MTGIEWLPGSVPGVSVVRATIMNVGPATMLFQTFDRLSVIVRTEPFSSSASATPLAGDWDCSYGNQCRLNEDLPPGVPMQIEFTVSSSEELTSVGVSAYSSNFPADPDRSNDGRTLTR